MFIILLKIQNMKKRNFFPILLFCCFSISVFAGNHPANNFQKRFGKKSAPGTENTNSNLYKPGKSLNYFWNASDWMFTGNSLMTYTSIGKILTQIDSGFSYRKTSYTYDAQQRETERLDQNYNSASQIWENSNRQVTAYNAQGDEEENRSEIWNGMGWMISYGNQFLRSYNTQNLLTEYIEKNWNSSGSAWENRYMETEFVYDAQNRLQSYVSKNWDTTQWINEEKSLWQYGLDNKPSQVILQEWNGSSFVDSTRITDITWNFWNGILSQSDPSQYTMQKLVSGNWTNDIRFTFTRDLNGSNTFLNEIFVGGNWVPDSRMRLLYDDQQNPVLNIDEEYNPLTQSYDTVYCISFQSTYDNQGRILEQVVYNWDADLHQLNPMSKREFSQHSMFTAVSSASSLQAFKAVPNPVLSGSRLNIPGAAGVYQIRNFSGMSIQSGMLTPGGALSLESLAPGIYLIDFQNEMQGKQSVRVSVY